ncbi:beta-1,3-galactosyltransferase 1-like [Centruroides sculpturatus]|uniref:beta-1,3-galactosyltransferase 1-like n=1 Tax=Centruroides sculpturatus TaxID=218467 RepID=UPI000C6E7D66|nr:beta-1,3-galactosyltransferase 1-like [Centruroides sculpturatus]
MILSSKFRRTFLVFLCFTGAVLLVFFMISTQYLTITSMNLYREVRSHLPLVSPVTIISQNVTNYQTTEVPSPKTEKSVVNISENLVSEESLKQIITGIYEPCFDFHINKPTACNGMKAPVALIVISAVTKRSARNAIRATWGGYATKLGFPVLFLLGGTPYPHQQLTIDKEDAFFQDIIQEKCLDTYRNMTLKTVTLMKWVAEHCFNVPYILKTDDDMMINVDRLQLFLSSLNATKTIFGKLASGWSPHRSHLSKWYVPKSEYKDRVYPNFTTGPAYLFTSDSARNLYETSLKVPFLFLEDVYMTGIVAQQARIRRLSNTEFKNYPLRAAARTFKKIISSHGHSPRDIYKIWFRFYKPSVEDDR